jgi:hypothetical protein
MPSLHVGLWSAQVTPRWPVAFVADDVSVLSVLSNNPITIAHCSVRALVYLGRARFGDEKEILDDTKDARRETSHEIKSGNDFASERMWRLLHDVTPVTHVNFA